MVKEVGKRKGIALTAILLALLLAGCGAAAPTEPATPAQPAAAEPAAVSEESMAAPRVIIDQLGREVELPESIDRVATDRILPFPSVYFLATGTAEQIVGMHPASKSAAENSMLATLAPEILNANTGFAAGDEINIEELLKLNTDVVYIRAESGQIDLYDKAGITTVAIGTTGVAAGDSLATINSWLELLDQIYDLDDRAKGIIEYGNRAEAEIAAIVSDVAEKPRAMMLFNYTDGKPIISGKGFFGNYWLNATGAIDVAEDDLQGQSPVDMEQIYRWNPEIIYITNFTELMPEDFYNNTIEGLDWSQIEAVKNGQVYKIPLGIYRWFAPSGDTPLMLQWLAQKNHPERFTYDMSQILKDYYLEYYYYSLSDEEVEKILNPVREAAQGI
ncbi:ABC transporter substrate-binding protein [Anoxynatronum buryatiense]|uniref:Iron complex transport system substrate-binding protein n=1 Tax=Anoxynatronum buryatiense TaxID=489973 RepID=A0AA46AJE9_9CLOT|nr:ABC transporter substrate-binding protein [Anoxynatronum buryatiense]SMP60675.1 iron complex transport system substrate-binding protein [Anoxynatronum buryatiense]